MREFFIDYLLLYLVLNAGPECRESGKSNVKEGSVETIRNTQKLSYNSPST